MNGSNTIADRQKRASNLYRLAAQRRLYSRAKAILSLQLLIGAIFPLLATIGVVAYPTSEPWLAFAAIVLSALDAAWLSRTHRSLRGRAALIQEEFDCDVLTLPWNSLKCPSRPSPEEIRKASAKAQRRSISMKRFENWYPEQVGELPLPLGRVICQRTNASWDAELRGHLRTLLVWILVVVAMVVLTVGLYLGQPLPSLVRFTAVAILPLFLVVLREWQEHGDAEKRALNLRDYALERWNDALRDPKGLTDHAARQLQDAILEHRTESPLIPDWLYFLLRKTKERLAVETTADLVAQAKATVQD